MSNYESDLIGGEQDPLSVWTHTILSGRHLSGKAVLFSGADSTLIDRLKTYYGVRTEPAEFSGINMETTTRQLGAAGHMGAAGEPSPPEGPDRTKYDAFYLVPPLPMDETAQVETGSLLEQALAACRPDCIGIVALPGDISISDQQQARQITTVQNIVRRYGLDAQPNRVSEDNVVAHLPLMTNLYIAPLALMYPAES